MKVVSSDPQSANGFRNRNSGISRSAIAADAISKFESETLSDSCYASNGTPQTKRSFDDFASTSQIEDVDDDISVLTPICKIREIDCSADLPSDEPEGAKAQQAAQITPFANHEEASDPSREPDQSNPHRPTFLLYRPSAPSQRNSTALAEPEQASILPRSPAACPPAAAADDPDRFGGADWARRRRAERWARQRGGGAGGAGGAAGRLLRRALGQLRAAVQPCAEAKRTLLAAAAAYRTGQVPPPPSARAALRGL